MSFTESNDRCGAPQSPGCIHPPTHYVSYLSATAGIRYGDGPLQPATVFTRVCGWCVDGIPSRLTVELLSEIAPPVQLAEADVNERPDELPSAGEPMHITAALAALAQLRDTFRLPHPLGVRFTKCNGLAAVEVETFGEVVAWAQALGQSGDPISHVHGDGSSSHSVWVRWQGWDVRVGAWIEPLAPVEVVAAPPRGDCASGCNEQFAAADCPEHGVVAFLKAAEPERTIFTHCNWIGGCGTPLSGADGSMLCPVHAAAPLEDAMAHYSPELQGGAS